MHVTAKPQNRRTHLTLIVLLLLLLDGSEELPSPLCYAADVGSDRVFGRRMRKEKTFEDAVN